MTAIGALTGLVLAIFLITKKVSPAYSLIAGALAGGLTGGLGLGQTVTVMTDGVKDITPAIIRILTAGVLSGIMIKTGAAETISNTIIDKLGKTRVYLALALSTMLLCAMGVFIDVAVITVAPIALTIGNRLGLPKSVLLMALIGGGKCGNIISPNPNTIIAAQNMGASLSTVIFYNLLPAVMGLLFTVWVVIRIIPKNGEKVVLNSVHKRTEKLPSFLSSIVAPVVTILLLSMRPICGITIDPLIALPIGGLCGIVCMRQMSNVLTSIEYGLSKMSGVAILLIGTGAIAGIIKNSVLTDWILRGLASAHINGTLIAPISGALMSAATASTTAGATLASASFSDAILAVGVSAAWGAAMINSAATVLDHLPHGSFFHATGGVCDLNFKQRLKLVPYESLVGAVLASVTTIMCLICR